MIRITKIYIYVYTLSMEKKDQPMCLVIAEGGRCGGLGLGLCLGFGPGSA